MSVAPPRIGCVRYLNALPLMYGHSGEVLYDHPSRLAALLGEGALDVALVPAFKLFQRPGWRVVDRVSISCDGPVYSVFMAYKGRLQDIRSVALDSASLSSANLLRCVLAEFHGLNPEFGSSACDAQMLIGNQAIAFRQEHGAVFNYLDLGEEWKRRTGLPFVFALWLIRPECQEAEKLALRLRALREAGVSHIEQIAASVQGADREFVRRYLTENIRYGLGAAEKQALQRYGALLSKHGLLEAGPFGWTYI